MKKEIIDHVVSSFTDYLGNERKFVVVAVSSPLSNIKIVDEDGNTESAAKSLSIGFAICNVSDEFDENLGITIATNKAKYSKNPLRAFTMCSGMINTQVVRAWIDQEIKYFINNPDSHIPGYNEAKYKYFEKLNSDKLKQEAKGNLSLEQLEMVDKLNSYSPEIRNTINLLINEK